MRKILAFLLPLSILIHPTSGCCVGVNPITVSYDSGTSTFSMASSGTANYVVRINNGVTPNNARLLLHNTTGAISGLEATQRVAGGSPCSGLEPLCGSTFSLRAGESCCLTFSLVSHISGNYSLRPKVSTSPLTYSAQAPSGLLISVLKDTTPSLGVSATELALSIRGLTLNGVPSGTPRQFVVTNTGGVPVTGISITQPGLPTNASMSTSCVETLGVGETCSITITPGEFATSDCTTYPGTAPTPSLITLRADGISPINMNFVVLGYGCIYQEGYIFSMRETTSPTESIGGTVAALSDYSGTPVWSSNSHGSTTADVSYDLIPGIGETSTSSVGLPSFSDFAVYFAATYTTPLALTPIDFRQCDARTDGRCNTANIVKFYTYYQTNYGVGVLARYTPTVASTPPSDYAAGVCDTYNSGTYQDWYLPAICELSVGKPTDVYFSGCGTVTAPLIQNIEQNLAARSIGSFQYRASWSSTQFTLFYPFQYAWNSLMSPQIDFASNGGGDKGDALTAVRCVRALTF